MTTLLVENPAGLDHDTPPGHPEQVARLNAVTTALAGPEFNALDRVIAGETDDSTLRLGHPQSHIDAIRAAAPETGSRALDPDTHMSPGSLGAALKGVGGCVTAVDAVLDGAARTAFVATRPPGHHAERDRAMGFCLFSNIAIAARYALQNKGLSRVAVVDFDVHHGNGTQDVLWDEARALFISSHQMPLYPGTGSAGERGATDNVLNIPLPPGSGGDRMRQVYRDVVFPRLRAYRPELILVSAGFDAHHDDPLANLNWTTEDFAWITRGLCEVAGEVCDGRVVSTLEGGYDLSSLEASVAAHLSVLKEQSA